MTTEKCPTCGSPMEAGKPCPYCLLQLAAQSDSVLDSLPETLTEAEKSPRKTLDITVVQKAFSQLEIIEQIGRGGMGTVFKARQPKLDRFVALKILSEQLAEKPTFAERFAQEGKLLARLSHPNIVAVYDFGQTETTDDTGNALTFFFLILEYVDGVNLRQAMREERFTPEQALAIVPKICEALQYAHDEGVLHRDIKPENILLDTKGRIKIADFGIASVARWTADGAAAPLPKPAPYGRWSQSEEQRLTQTGVVLGTPNYMAPEQLETPGTVDHRADIYSLGVVFYELLTGELPKGQLTPPSEKTPVNAEIDGIVLKALQRDRSQRHQSAEELKTEIETAGMVQLNHESLTGAAIHPIKRSFFHLHPIQILIASVVALIVSLGLVVTEQTKLIPLEEKVALTENDLQLFQKIVDADQERLAPLKGYDPTDPRRLVAEAKLKTDLVFHREKEKAAEEARNVLDAAKEASSRWKVVVGWALGYCAVILGLLAFVSAWNQLKRLEFMPEKNGLIRSAIVLYTGIPVTLILIGFAIYVTVIAKGVLS